MFEGNVLVPMLPASDIDRAKSFYADKLGMTPTSEQDGELRYEAGGGWFLVYPSGSAGTNQATAATWQIEDIDGAVTEMKRRGVEFQDFEIEGMEMENSILTSPTGARAAWFFDSERNILGLMQQPS